MSEEEGEEVVEIVEIIEIFEVEDKKERMLVNQRYVWVPIDSSWIRSSRPMSYSQTSAMVC